MTTLRLEIDNLVLDGLSAEESTGFVAALEVELAQRMALESGVPGAAAVERQLASAVTAVLEARVGAPRGGNRG